MLRIPVLLVIFSFCSVVRAQAPIDRIYVFGDSYSDIGRGWVDSDGPTAVAYMAQRMGLTMVPSNTPDAEEKSLDFAVSGAPTGEKSKPSRSQRLPWTGNEKSGRGVRREGTAMPRSSSIPIRRSSLSRAALTTRR